MRLLAAAALGSLLVSTLTGTDIERALALSRARDAERQQFHHRYVFDLHGADVTQIEIVTEFRRLVMIGEDHVLRGDSMFTRGVRAAQDALAPSRGMVTIKAQVRFNPLNTYIEPPPYTIAIGAAPNGALQPIDTQIAAQYSSPVKVNGRELSSLTGATLQSTIEATRIGQTTRSVAVVLGGNTVAGTVVDFSHLD
ncbi:MAG TPA: hypothetical protein VG963_31175 [Polyangiaceae bacterium]|nr:hypothetical protein [Polyangiaceae bacterium]